MYKVVLLAVITIVLGSSVGLDAQTRIGSFRASQLVDKEFKEGSLDIYHAKALGFKDYCFSQGIIGSDQVWMGFNKSQRSNLTEILTAYQKVENAMPVPEKLPAEKEIGRISAIVGFRQKKGEPLHLDNKQDFVFNIKWDRNGEPELSIHVGRVESDKVPDYFLIVPNIFLKSDYVEDMKYELSERNFQNFLESSNQTINPEILKFIEEVDK